MIGSVKLFTDGSVNPKSKVGYGAYLVVYDDNQTLYELENSVKTVMFMQTSSTKLELQTLLWALKEISTLNKRVTIYTDSQNTVGLLNRRSKFEKNAYMTKKNRLIDNHELYKEFYKIVDTIKCDIIKVKGHKLEKDKDEIDAIFTLVDRASRDALRQS